MVAPRVNGRRIADYKDVTVRETGLAVVEAEPLYRGSVSDGYRVDDFIVDDSLVLNIPFYRLLGSSFSSVDRYGIVSTVAGPLWRPTGRKFDGINDIITLAAHSVLDNFDITSDFSCELWINIEDAAASTLIHKLARPGSATGFACGVVGGTMQWYFNGAAKNSGIAVSIRTPHHLVYTYNGTGDDKARFYLDGPLVNTSTAVVAFAANNEVVEFSGTGGGFAFYDGTISEVRIYTKTLSAEDVLQNRNATRWRYQ